MKLEYFYLLFILVLASCSATKGLKPDEKLFTGTKIAFADRQNVNNKGQLSTALEDAAPTPNVSGFLNIRTGLYNIYDSTGTSGFRHTIKNRLGSKPVIFKNRMIENTEARMGKVMTDYGYFRSLVGCDSTSSRRRVKLECDISSGARYKIGKIEYPYGNREIGHVAAEKYKLRNLKSGNYYKQSDIVNDRNNIINTVRNNGYIYFDSRDLVFYVDTLKNKAKSDLYVEILPSKDSVTQCRYVVGDIYVDTRHVLNNDTTSTDYIKDEETGIYFTKNNDFVKNAFIRRMLVPKKGEYVSQDKLKLSINRLLNLGIFKFVRNEMQLVGNDTLNQYFAMTPSVTKTITGELELNNRSGNYFGTAGSVAFINKNVFKGGEQFKVGLSGGIETQFGSETWINSRQVKATTSLEFPRLIMPFRAKSSKYFVPWTVLSGSINYQRRIGYFSINDFQLKFGYRWKENARRTHELYPIDFNNFYIFNIDSTFAERIKEPRNIRLRESYEDKLVLGVRYIFTYNNATDVGSRDNWYSRTEVFTAGNTYGLLERTFPKLKESFSNRVSQFVKITTDLRKYWKVGDSDVATRFYVGAGVAYGRSSQMPYSDQFSIGGANSIRAFSLRSLGPGGYIPDTSSTSQYLDQTGDFKLETNLEYRFPIFGFVKGALFADAGNIWLLERGIDKGQKFAFSDFYKNIAIGTGFGMRFDFNFFVFRLDLGIPVRGPIDGKFQWNKKYDIFSRSWRREYLKWNIGIGYPF